MATIRTLLESGIWGIPKKRCLPKEDLTVASFWMLLGQIIMNTKPICPLNQNPLGFKMAKQLIDQRTFIPPEI